MAERLRADGVETERHQTRSLEDARLAACEAAASFDAVVAVGGDGTVGRAPPAWPTPPRRGGPRRTGRAGRAGGGPGRGWERRRPQPRAAGRRPAGRGRLLARLRRRPADLATVAGRAYLNVAGAGFDSEVNRVANQRLGWAGNRPRYVGAVLAELVVGRVATFELALDGRPTRLRGWLVAVANGPSYGGGMKVAPNASLDDGLLDVVVIHEIGKLEFLRTFPKVFSGRHLEHPAVAVHRAARVDLDADRTLAVYADGEPAGTLPATFEVRRAAITVLAADPAPGFPSP